MSGVDPSKMTPEQQQQWYMNLTPDEKASYGIGAQALTGAEYTALFTMAIRQAGSHDDQGGNIFDAHSLKYMQNTLGTVIPFLDCPGTWAPKRNLYTLGGGTGEGGGGGSPPQGVPAAPQGVPAPRPPSPAPRQSSPAPKPAAPPPRPASPAPKQSARSNFRAPKPTQSTANSDALGGMAEDCPENLHAQMLGMLAQGDVSPTSLQQRSENTKKRRTFHGPAALREAVRWGYLHPSLPPPRGMRWREVVSGVQLVGQVPASVEGVASASPEAQALVEGGSGAEE